MHNSIYSNSNILNFNDYKITECNYGLNNSNIKNNNYFNLRLKEITNTENKQNNSLKTQNSKSSINLIPKTREVVNYSYGNYNKYNSVLNIKNTDYSGYTKKYDNYNNFGSRSQNSRNISPLNNYLNGNNQGNSRPNIEFASYNNDEHILKNINKNILNNEIANHYKRVIFINKKPCLKPYKKKVIDKKDNLKNNIHFITFNTTNNITSKNVTNYNIISSNKNNLKLSSFNKNNDHDYTYHYKENMCMEKKNSQSNMTINKLNNNNNIKLNPKLNYIQVPRSKYTTKIFKNMKERDSKK